MWIQELKDDSKNHPWKSLAQTILEKCDSDYIFHPNLKLPKSGVKAVTELPSFYRELILLSEKLSSCSKLNNCRNSRCITSSPNEALFCQNLIRKHTRFVIDWIDVNGRHSHRMKYLMSLI